MVDVFESIDRCFSLSLWFAPPPTPIPPHAHSFWDSAAEMETRAGSNDRPISPASTPVYDSDRTHGLKSMKLAPDANLVASTGGRPAALPPSPTMLDSSDGSVRWNRGRNGSPPAALARWPCASSMMRARAADATSASPSFLRRTWDRTDAQLR